MYPKKQKIFSLFVVSMLFSILLPKNIFASGPTIPVVTLTPSTSTSINISWTASTASAGIKYYTIFKRISTSPTASKLVDLGSTTLSYMDTGLTTGATYYYQIFAQDTLGAIASSSVMSATTLDLSPPTAPTNVSATAGSCMTVNLSWTASTDNIGVTSYSIVRNGSTINSTTGTSYVDTGGPSTSYTYSIVANDAAGNTTSSTGVNITTSPSSSSCIPSEFSDLYPVLQTDLTNFNTSLGTVAPTPVLFFAEGKPADGYYAGANTAGYYTASVKPYLDGLQTMGVKGIKIQVGFPLLYPPFYQQKFGNLTTYNAALSFYQTLKNDLATRGMKLAIQCEITPPAGGAATSDPYNLGAYYTTMNFWPDNNQTTGRWYDQNPTNYDQSSYTNGRIANCVNIAKILAPDYLNVQAEPDTEKSKFCGPFTAPCPNTMDNPSSQGVFIQHMMNALDTAGISGLHTTITVGAGMGAWNNAIAPGNTLPNYVRFLNNDLAVNADAIDIHVYPINSTSNVDYLSIANDIATRVKNSGTRKKLVMDESWLHKIRDSGENSITANDIYARDNYSFWTPLDQQFLQVMANFGYKYNFSFISASYGEHFFGYLDYFNITATPPLTIACAVPPGPPTGSCTASDLNTDNGKIVYQVFGTTPLALTPTGQSYAQIINNTPAPDTQAPTVPIGLVATTLSTSQIGLSWTASTDNTAVAGYTVYRGGVQTGTTTTTSYTDSSLTTNTTYSYTISAYDTTGNVSSTTASVTATTQSDTAPGGGGSSSSGGSSGGGGGSSGGGGGVASTQSVSLGINVTATSSTVTTSNGTKITATPDVPFFTETLTIGSTGSQVSLLQTYLITQGLLKIPAVTGYMGTLTKNAVILFQEKYIIPQTEDEHGKVGPLTRAKLNELFGINTTIGTTVPPTGQLVSSARFNTLLALGTKNDRVSALQIYLNKDPSLYPEGLVTGYFGQATKRAVQRFQVKYGIANPGDEGYGQVGPRTRAQLNLLVQ